MGPHVETICQFGMMHHEQLQAEASQGRLVVQLEETKQRVPPTVSVRFLVGSALVACGMRILGPPHIGSRRAMMVAGSAGTPLA